MDRTWRPSPLPGLTVRVLNGCGVDGLAQDTASRLRGLGQDVVEVGDAPHHDFRRSLLIDRRGRPHLTGKLAERIGPILLLLEKTEGADCDATLIVGADHASLGLFASP